MWLRLHVQKICDRIVADREANFAKRIAEPPRHLKDEVETPEAEADIAEQDSLEI